MSGRMFRQVKRVESAHDELCGCANGFPCVARQAEIERERREQGPWIPACGGTETPFRTRTGRTLLYCWQPTSGRHAYLDCGTDVILSDEEAFNVLGK